MRKRDKRSSPPSVEAQQLENLAAEIALLAGRMRRTARVVRQELRLHHGQ